MTSGGDALGLRTRHDGDPVAVAPHVGERTIEAHGKQALRLGHGSAVVVCGNGFVGLGVPVVRDENDAVRCFTHTVLLRPGVSRSGRWRFIRLFRPQTKMGSRRKLPEFQAFAAAKGRDGYHAGKPALARCPSPS